jgi:hypothetical protein
MKRVYSILLTALVSLAISVAYFEGNYSIGIFAILFGLSYLMPKQEGVLNEVIAFQQARGVYTEALIAVFRESVPVMSFLRSFFPASFYKTKIVSIEVQRGTETIAVDVIRGTNGNRNKVTRSTLKEFLPPYFDEYFNINELDAYDRALGSEDPRAMANLSAESASKLIELRNKIERAIELMCAQIFEFGVISLVSGDSIDFKRKAASLVANNAGNTWATGTVSPYDTLEAGAKFLRETGKVMGSNFNVILGGEALNDFLKNDIVLQRNDIVRLPLDQIQSPVKNAVGSSYHGRVSAGSYTFDLWTYPEVYEDESGVNHYYWNEKKICILPEITGFKMAYALVPQLLTGGQTPQVGEYLIQDFIDERQTAHEQHIKSAPIPVPVKVDQMYTVQVVA